MDCLKNSCVLQCLEEFFRATDPAELRSLTGRLYKSDGLNAPPSARVDLLGLKMLIIQFHKLSL